MDAVFLPTSCRLDLVIPGNSTCSTRGVIISNDYSSVVPARAQLCSAFLTPEPKMFFTKLFCLPHPSLEPWPFSISSPSFYAELKISQREREKETWKTKGEGERK
jgi:hypothetical protein